MPRRINIEEIRTPAAVEYEEAINSCSFEQMDYYIEECRNRGWITKEEEKKLFYLPSDQKDLVIGYAILMHPQASEEARAFAHRLIERT